ncbi:MAG: 30S ribosomal protein S12 methylthiotransferase RimO [Verrucomicrobiae bacterium]|jgi:ribosomal protein S12 methylthiotransferase|nr:30S ribosomal protein S12 methylthiotransferase RimO [Verrucomicrobiae bacterium]
MSSSSPIKRKVGLVSLGCAKNLVDAEILLGDAARHGYELTQKNEEADVVLVNTCGFIDLAKEESINAILEAHRQRLHGSKTEQKIVVGGCLSQRYSADLAKQLPEVDAFLGLDEISRAGEIFNRLFEEDVSQEDRVTVSRRAAYIPDFDTPRVRLTAAHTTYVKIAEGCNHPCSFCVIPRMRGRHRSRTIESVVKEVQGLVVSGVKEINLVSQDTTYFGMDQWEEKAGPRQEVDAARGPSLIGLLDALGKIEGDFWIRLLYTHPAHWSDDLIAAIARNPKVTRYIDIPLQHIHEEMLAAMKRETGRQHIVDLIARLRSGIPELVIRTTFIVGFPGETEEHFESLLDFIRETRFERLGVFSYSREEESRAAKMPHQIHGNTKQRRLREAMLLQQQIAREWAESQVGKKAKVLADTAYLGRTQGDAPDVDCRVHFVKPVAPGRFVNCVITGTRDYDLVGDEIR